MLILVVMLVLSTKGKDTVQNNLINNNKDNENMSNSNEQTNNIDSFNEEIFLDKAINKVTITGEYYRAEACVKELITYLRANNQNAIYAISNGQPIFNREEILQPMKIQEMYSVDNDNGTTFFINIRLGNSRYYILVINDFVNSTFQISALSEQEYNNIIQNRNTAKYTTYTEVTKNEYNDIKYVTLNNETLAQKYFESYIQNARYYPEDAYNSLDEEYRNAKFGNYENYLNYLANKSKELESLDRTSIKKINEFASEEEYENYIANLEQKSMSKYYFYTKDNVNYCICTDEYNNYYIFKIISVMNYKLILDTYTIDLPEFIEQYEEADEEEKVELNINKIFKALNDNDYNYVYNKLEEDYRNTYFSDTETFKTQLSNVLFTKNNVELLEYTVQENEHKYSLGITDAEGSDENGVKLTIIVILGENTDFTIKFE